MKSATFLVIASLAAVTCVSCATKQNTVSLTKQNAESTHSGESSSSRPNNLTLNCYSTNEEASSTESRHVFLYLSHDTNGRIQSAFTDIASIDSAQVAPKSVSLQGTYTLERGISVDILSGGALVGRLEATKSADASHVPNGVTDRAFTGAFELKGESIAAHCELVEIAPGANPQSTQPEGQTFSYGNGQSSSKSSYNGSDSADPNPSSYANMPTDQVLMPKTENGKTLIPIYNPQTKNFDYKTPEEIYSSPYQGS